MPRPVQKLESKGVNKKKNIYIYLYIGCDMAARRDQNGRQHLPGTSSWYSNIILSRVQVWVADTWYRIILLKIFEGRQP